ncbi:MAG: low molecular weight phosphotyrosine protein phosphatase [Lachnospiraceae bacterium]|nr:low molecular weight phosphotyrosine protein phosphatase [Lachnospiraceae bacterium]
MIRVLFVCHGNICRSPMAEFICKKKIEERGLAGKVYTESAATSFEEIGNPVYPPAQRKLREKGITDFTAKRARHMEKADYAQFDYMIGMDNWNIRNMMRILGSDPDDKVYMMMEFAGRTEEVDDPWYTGDFEGVYRQLDEAIDGLLDQIGQ